MVYRNSPFTTKTTTTVGGSLARIDSGTCLSHVLEQQVFVLLRGIERLQVLRSDGVLHRAREALELCLDSRPHLAARNEAPLYPVELLLLQRPQPRADRERRQQGQERGPEDGEKLDANAGIHGIFSEFGVP